MVTEAVFWSTLLLAFGQDPDPDKSRAVDPTGWIERRGWVICMFMECIKQSIYTVCWLPVLVLKFLEMHLERTTLHLQILSLYIASTRLGLHFNALH